MTSTKQDVKGGDSSADIEEGSKVRYKESYEGLVQGIIHGVARVNFAGIDQLAPVEDLEVVRDD